MPVYQVTTLQEYLGQQVRNVYYYDSDLELDTDQKQQIADAFETAYQTLVANVEMMPSWSVRGVEIRRVDVPDLPSSEFSFVGGDIVGTSTDLDPTPAQIAILGSFQADTPFPRRARSYHAGLAGAMLEQGGNWQSSALTAFDNFWNDLRTITVESDQLGRVAVHWDPVNNVVDDWNTLTNQAVKGNPATQRRRRLGQGI